MRWGVCIFAAKIYNIICIFVIHYWDYMFYHMRDEGKEENRVLLIWCISNVLGMLQIVSFQVKLLHLFIELFDNDYYDARILAHTHKKIDCTPIVNTVLLSYARLTL